MHRHVREHLEEVLAASQPKSTSDQGPVENDVASYQQHLADCRDCSEEVAMMQRQAVLLQSLRGPEKEPRAGFYARVLERIESEGAISIWNLFCESPFGHRLAIASLALAALFCVCLVSSERFFDNSEVAQDAQVQTVIGGNQSSFALTGALDSNPDQDSVLVNLVTYREQ